MDWEEDEIVGPNVESRETLLELAKMTNNAYLQPNETGWYSLNETAWNAVRLYLLSHSLLDSNMFPPSLILSDGNQKVMGFAARYSPHLIIQPSSFR